ncbi:type II secretion system protein [Azonexus sp.]|jgi:prepilin-type N-terminal cleavage/methylation domain-containing protein|uniref:type II secretion system protein n=1 Tax=Azonexus sp. TaxID=1872668 RepID=UPI002833D5FE|nr:type II secretion system protein [Azonexus sp.]MDR1996301.1 type II secretion system GspH family protein [Azonexus sp.]
MTRHRPLHRRNHGFSLVELAIVLIIFSLLAGGLMMTLTTQQEIQRLSEVRRQLADIREALLGYVVVNGYLPPAANPALASGAEGAGLSESGQEAGVLPWATLGLPETDPWGQRFTYRVNQKFIKAPASPALSGFKLSDAGDIIVTDGAVNIATNLPAIVVSHGRNGLGGYGRNGLQRAGAAGDELKNASDNKEFVSRVQGPNFDDEVIWVPLPILMSRMVTTGRLP